MFGSTRLAPTSTGIMIRRLQIMLPLWYLWSKFNPWVNEYNEEKKKLIKYCHFVHGKRIFNCLLYTSPSPRDGLLSRMPSSA